MARPDEERPEGHLREGRQDRHPQAGARPRIYRRQRQTAIAASPLADAGSQCRPAYDHRRHAGQERMETRAALVSQEALLENSPDSYSFTRAAYLQRRDFTAEVETPAEVDNSEEDYLDSYMEEGF